MAVQKDDKIKKHLMIHTRLNKNLFELLKKKADDNDISVSHMVRIILQKAADPSCKINVGVDFDQVGS